MNDVSLSTFWGFLGLLFYAALVGLVVGLVVWLLLWIIGRFVTIDEVMRRNAAAVVGAIAALIVLISRLF